MEFACRLGLPDGRVVEETHHASDENALRVELDRRGVHLFEARPKGIAGAFRLPHAKGRRKHVPERDFMVLNQELASLLKAGLPLTQALDIMLERMRPGAFREVLIDVRNRVSSGEELSDAFSAHGEMFPRLYSASLKAGERSGELEKVLRRFIRYTKLVSDARRRVVSALAYPAVIICVSIAMIIVISVVVVPKFQDFFTTLNVKLPWMTRVTLASSSFLVANGVPILLALAIAVVVFLQWKSSPAGRVAIDRFKLRLPFVGPVLHLFAMSEFCRAIGTLLSGGIPLLQAFEVGTQAVGNSHVRAQLEPTIRMVHEGGAFYSALEASNVFMPLAIDMVKVGETTGALDEMLNSVSDFFDEEVETRLQRILSLVEPLMLVFLGMVVALLLVSIYLPLFGSLSQGTF